ncbi:MAG TPA: molecular chaperone HtpG [Erysipelotrichaceae bacterium]|nr:molecular chaperone HtpG [Erysipelotrichaceae bacterium]
MKEVKEFQTESKELLNLMINSIYSNNEIFLRELISNASDAIDKYRYKALTSDGKIPLQDFGIDIKVNKKKRSITIADNGIGMNREELVENLGTIAKSGSKDFASRLKEAKEKQDLDIIGQFGVGFYSAFMVASKVEVLTKTIDEKGCLFISDGRESYTIEDAEKEQVGTEITIYLKKSTKEVDYDGFLEEYRIRNLVKKYSDYIRYPIRMLVKKKEQKLDKDGKPIEGKFEDKEVLETLNSMIPLWKKNKKEVTDEELNAFYKDKFNDYTDPFTSLFLKVDGKITYDALLFIPSHIPYNLYSENYEKGLQLYSKGIFIKDKCPELIPDYLKFVKGLVDSGDFSLNISREMLQQSPIMKKISDNIEKKIIDNLKGIKKNDFEKYISFWKNFGDHIKYGLYATYGTKKELLQDLLVFPSLNNDDKYISLNEYKENMGKKQKYIYYASGENLDAIKLLPQIEKYKKNGIDVLLLDQKIDEFAILMLREFDKVEFKSISDEAADEVSKEDQEKVEKLTNENKRLLDTLKESLSEKVDDVVISTKLVEAPVCLSTKDGLSLEMEKTLNEQPGMEQNVKAQKVLEINPNHALFEAFSAIQKEDEKVKKYASILYEEAMLLEGRNVTNKQEFVEKINDLMLTALKK